MLNRGNRQRWMKCAQLSMLPIIAALALIQSYPAVAAVGTFARVQNHKYLQSTSSQSSQGTGLSVRAIPATATSSAKVVLAWNASANATSYNVYRATTSGGEGNTPIATGVASTTYTDTGLSNGTTYYYEVTAVNAYGESPKSNEAHATPVAAGATFVKTDSSTAGSWKGVYGGDGYNVVGNTASYPSYAQVSTTGATSYTWAASSIDGRAVQKAAAGAPDRVAAAWYSGTSFTIDVNLIDGNSHQVALYLLDWGGNSRVQNITVADADTNTTLDTRSASSFHGGIYDVWNMIGHVKITVSMSSGGNAVLSGIFFGPGSGSTSPAAVSNLAATPGSTRVALSWTASTGATSYNVYRGTTSGGESMTPAATGITGTSYTNTGLTAGTTYYYQVVAVNAVGGSPGSNEASATVPSSTATFVKSDTTTQGNWKGVYGADGWNVAGDTSGSNPKYPSYASVSISGQTGAIVAASTTDVRALLKTPTGSTDRVCGLWYSTTSETFDVNLTDGNAHQVALYFLDWGSNSRVQSITVKDAAAGATLDTRSVSSFHNGIYDVWNLKGHVKIVVTYTGPAGYNAVVSGIFFGGAAGSTVPSIPAGLLASPGSTQVTLTWTASAGATSYNLYRSTTAGGEGTTPIKTGIATTTYTDTGLTNGTKYYYRLLAVNAVGGSGISAEASATPIAVTASASFVTSDTTTQGNWKGVYGADGWNVCGDPSGNNPTTPSYAQMSISGQTTYVAASSTTDVRALLKSALNSTDRVAGLWYSATSETFDINLTDGNTHPVALYFLDWGSNSRVQSITVEDAGTSTVLDSRSVSSFHNGIYDVWNLKGHIKIVVTYTGPAGYNATVSGVFFR